MKICETFDFDVVWTSGHRTEFCGIREKLASTNVPGTAVFLREETEACLNTGYK